MSDNPLLKYARRPALSVKLASSENWYPEGFIQYTLNGEVEVYPMLPKDELMLLNPDALLSGQAMVSLIKSCCPSILDPSKLFYPDVNILLLAIKRATYGSIHKQQYFCSKCQEEMKKLSKEDIVKKEKDGTLMTHEEDIELNIDAILTDVTPLKDEYKEKIGQLIYYFQPIRLKEKEHFSLISNRRNKLLKFYVDMLKRTEDISIEEKNKAIVEIEKIQEDIIDSNNIILSDCIQKIELPDGSFVEDKELIRQYIQNCETTVTEKINDIIKGINECGIKQTIKVSCECCGNEEEILLEGFNQSDFFV